MYVIYFLNQTFAVAIFVKVYKTARFIHMVFLNKAVFTEVSGVKIKRYNNVRGLWITLEFFVFIV